MMRTMSCAIIAVSLSACAHQQFAAIEQQILALEHERQQAQLHGDWQTIQRLNAPDFTEVGADGSMRTGMQNSQAMRSGAVKFDSIEHSGQQVRIFGSTAIVTGVVRRTGSYAGTPFQQHLRYVRVYVRSGGSWRTVFAQNTRVEEH